MLPVPSRHQVPSISGNLGTNEVLRRWYTVQAQETNRKQNKGGENGQSPWVPDESSVSPAVPYDRGKQWNRRATSLLLMENSVALLCSHPSRSLSLRTPAGLLSASFLPWVWPLHSFLPSYCEHLSSMLPPCSRGPFVDSCIQVFFSFPLSPEWLPIFNISMCLWPCTWGCHLNPTGHSFKYWECLWPQPLGLKPFFWTLSL